jgi:thiol:disulfide interchange protein DsbD
MKITQPIVVSLAAGLHLGWVDKNQASFKIFPWLKTTIGTVCLVFAAFWATSWAIQGPGVTWHPYSAQLLHDAAVQNKPVIIDFYAEWCAPCREFEEIVFHHPDVVRQGEGDFIMVKVDVTKGGNPFHEQLLKQYDVKGVPTIVFLDSKGTERTDLRLVDFLPPNQFLVNMSSVKK